MSSAPPAAGLLLLLLLFFGGGGEVQCHPSAPCQGMGLIIKHAKTSRILVGAHDCAKNFTSLSDFTAKPQIQFPGQPAYANYTVMFLSSNYTGPKIKEYKLHWLVSNILPIGSTLSQKGTTLAEYWAPGLPPVGRTAAYRILVYEQKRLSVGLHRPVKRQLRSHFRPELWLEDRAVASSIVGLYGSAQFYAARSNTTHLQPPPPPPPPGFVLPPTTANNGTAPPVIGFSPEVYAPPPPPPPPAPHPPVYKNISIHDFVPPPTTTNNRTAPVIGFSPEVYAPPPPPPPPPPHPPVNQNVSLLNSSFVPPPTATNNRTAPPVIGFSPEVYAPPQPPLPRQPPPPLHTPVNQNVSLLNTILLHYPGGIRPTEKTTYSPVYGSGFLPPSPQPFQPDMARDQEYVVPVVETHHKKKKKNKNSAGRERPPGTALLAVCAIAVLAIRH